MSNGVILINSKNFEILFCNDKIKEILFHSKIKKERKQSASLGEIDISQNANIKEEFKI